jgi:hypothetical protein
MGIFVVLEVLGLFWSFFFFFLGIYWLFLGYFGRFRGFGGILAILVFPGCFGHFRGFTSRSYLTLMITQAKALCYSTS